MTIRRAQNDDVNEILNYDIKAWKIKYDKILPEVFLKNICSGDEERKHALIRKEKEINKFIIADDNSKVLGIAKIDDNCLNMDSTVGQIHLLYSEDKKIKKELLIEAINILKKDGYSKVAITTTINSDICSLTNEGAKKTGVYDFILNNEVYNEDIYVFDL